MRRVICASVAVVLVGGCGAGAQDPTEGKIDAYVQSYVESRNFSGVVLVQQGGHTEFEHAYGMADREHGVANTWDTRFHIASVSMQYTAAAILRLVDEGKLSLDEHVSTYAPQITGSDKIRVRDLLTEQSGIPDINALPDYNDLLQRPQTAQSLVAKVAGQSLLFEPGTKYLHEEHSAYNVLALILEKKTGLPFAEAVRKLVLKPAGLKGTFIDDDGGGGAARVARGYEPEGVDGLKDATAIHWSAKTGNASVCTTARDQAWLMRALAKGTLLSKSSREAMFEGPAPAGYGWFKRDIRPGLIAHIMNGRAPGFSSFVAYLPRRDMTVVVFSNIYSSATTTMGYDVLWIMLHRAVEPPKLGGTLSDPLNQYAGVFAFGEDFYQKNARLELKEAGGHLALLWPSGDVSPLIPAGKDRFIDRSYWETVTVKRDETGKVTGLRYGEFEGKVVQTN